ncbi:Papain family cysteine protease [Aphelenchoides fujianensis]|nr:Papain family cysteine protease [Aphelenchoides fujianensis]
MRTGPAARHYHRFNNRSVEELRGFLGALRPPTGAIPPNAFVTDDNEESDEKFDASSTWGTSGGAAGKGGKLAAAPIASTFDARTKWPKCRGVIGRVHDQSNCGGCWAIASAAVITDRRCIRFNGTWTRDLSAWDLISCCKSCTPYANGCQGGWPNAAFAFFDHAGVVTGGAVRGRRLSAAAQQPKRTTCSRKCQAGYSREYARDKRRGRSFRVFRNRNAAVQREIARNGPVVATFDVYQDFYHYEKGVYEHEAGALVGGHAVKVVGWGQTPDGVPYWTAVNSWGSDWGEGGTFRIRRGADESNFESFIVSGNVQAD